MSRSPAKNRRLTDIRIDWLNLSVWTVGVSISIGCLIGAVIGLESVL